MSETLSMTQKEVLGSKVVYNVMQATTALRNKTGFEISYNPKEWDDSPLRVWVVPHSHNDPGSICCSHVFLYEGWCCKVGFTLLMSISIVKPRTFWIMSFKPSVRCIWWNLIWYLAQHCKILEPWSNVYMGWNKLLCHVVGYSLRRKAWHSQKVLATMST